MMDDNIKYHNQLWYYKTYNKLIENCKTRGLIKSKLTFYSEKHHIVPKCMGGDNSEVNLVLLTPKEHIIAHLLLTKIFPSNHSLFIAAYASLLKNKGRCEKSKYISVRTLVNLREEYSKRISMIS